MRLEKWLDKFGRVFIVKERFSPHKEKKLPLNPEGNKVIISVIKYIPDYKSRDELYGDDDVLMTPATVEVEAAKDLYGHLQVVGFKYTTDNANGHSYTQQLPHFVLMADYGYDIPDVDEDDDPFKF